MPRSRELAELAAAYDAGPLMFRNRIINGDMRIDQRNAGASVTPADGQYTLDRWRAGASAASKFSVQRSTVAPAGFTNSMLLTSLSAYSLTSTDNFEAFEFIEGLNVADLGWGTASAQPVTLSFWVRSSLTGTFGGAINNGSFTRSYPFAYTISAANTWEYKTVTIAGDTTGTWVTDNGLGLAVCICIGAGATRSGTAGAWSSGWFASATGATSVVGTNGATFYITGVQLEAGTVATPFERRPFGMELGLCQRYYQQWGGDDAYEHIPAIAMSNGGTGLNLNFGLPVVMRATPTASATGWTSQAPFGGTTVAINTWAISNSTPKSVRFDLTAASSVTSGAARVFALNNLSARLTLSAEL